LALRPLGSRCGDVFFEFEQDCERLSAFANLKFLTSGDDASERI
jgi:hypothetical protein